MAREEYAFHRVGCFVGGYKLSDYAPDGKISFNTIDEKYITTKAADGNPFFAYVKDNTMTGTITLMDKGEGYRLLNALRLAYWQESENGIAHPSRQLILDDPSEQTLIVGEIVFTGGMAKDFEKQNSSREISFTLVDCLQNSVFAGSSMGNISHNYIDQSLLYVQGR